MSNKPFFDIHSILDKCLDDNIHSEVGALLLSKGTVVTSKHLIMLQKHFVYPEQQKRIKENKVGDVPVVKEKTRSSFYKYEKKFESNVSNLKNLFEKRGNQQARDISRFVNQFSDLLEEMLSVRNAIEIIDSLRTHDDCTYLHSINVGILCGIIGKILGFPEGINLRLGEMGVLHDIGKKDIEQQILTKPGKLTDDEFREIKRHTIYGFNILQKETKMDMLALIGTLLHHERLDGSGYPFNLKGENIPFFVQILSVADTYDAIIGKRSYSDGRSSLAALEELKKDAFHGKLNLVIVSAFIKYVLQQMINQEATLSDGRSCTIVYCFEEDVLRPLVRVDDELVDLRKYEGLFVC